MVKSTAQVPGQAPETYKEYKKVFDKYKELYGATSQNQIAVFYQVGSFFELYDVVNKTTGMSWCNVKEVIDILGIQLSIKSTEDSNTELYFAGFPDYTLHRWAAKLTQIGWTVAVVEQKKTENWRGAVEISREVTRVLSPGTHNENAPTQEAAWVAAIWLEDQANQTPKYGLAAIDLTTGATITFEGQSRGKHHVWSADEALHFFQIHSPRETLFLWRGDTFSQPAEATVRRIFGILGNKPIHFRQALPSHQNSLEIELVREELLKKYYKPQTILPVREYLHIAGTHATERALCCLLRFIEDHFSLTKQLQEPISWNPTKNMLCGNNALAQLNIVGENLQDTVLGIFNKCITPMGKRAIRERLLTPLIEVAEIELRLDRVDSVMNLKEVEQPLVLMFDIPRLHRKIMNATITGGDVLALFQTYSQIQKLCGIVSGNLFGQVMPSPEEIQLMLDSWERFFSLEKAEKADAHITFLRRGISQEVDEIEEKIAKIYVEVRSWMGAFNMPDLKIEERDKLPISIRGAKQIIQAIQKNPMPSGRYYEGVECKITKSVGHSIEAPFLERANEKILSLRAQLVAKLDEVLPQVCMDYFNACRGGSIWYKLEEFVEEVDCSLCFAKVSKERGFYRPKLLPNMGGSSFKAKALRHPLIEALPSRSKYITHDVTLGHSSFGWLLYGMNASGKSSLMKAIGIATLLAQCGSFVPARELEIAPFERLMTRILNVDNLWAGLSSFAVEISELRDIFMRADNKTLVLGDELCSGTESVSATSLVAAGISYLLKKGSRFVFATHYHDLLKIPAIQDATNDKGLSVWHLKVRYDAAEDILVYERTLSPGSGSTLYGIEVARALGMPQEVLEEAIKFRRALQGEKVEEELAPSSWNSSIVSKACEVCGATLQKDLEVHHIRPRAEAKMLSNPQLRRFDDDGLARDSVRNLIVVCSKCHDAHHSAQIDISPILDTSAGQKRSPITSVTSSPSSSSRQSSAIKKEKYSSEQLEIIQKTITTCKGLPLKLIRGKLMREYEIIISDAALAKFA
jgi:DNA mismatch repair protein MutS